MDLRDNLITAFKTYCERTGLAPATASTKAANDGKFYDSLLTGAGFTERRYYKVMDWLKQNTPTNKTKKPRTN